LTPPPPAGDVDEDVEGPPAQPFSRRNFGAALADVIGFWAGSSFFDPRSILQEFMTHLTKSNLVIGLMTSVVSSSISLTQVLVANYVERLPIKKWYVVGVASVERLLLLVLALLTPLLAVKHPKAMVGVLFVLLAMHYLSMGCSMPAYSALISKIIPARRRGLLYGLGGTVANVLTLGTGLAIPYILRSKAAWGGFPNGYAVCFGVGFVILTASFLPLAFVNEPRDVVPDERRTMFEFFGDLWTILRTRRDFQLFVAATSLSIFGAAGTAFHMTYAIRELGAGVGESGRFTFVMSLGALASFFWGALADRTDNRVVLLLSSLLVGCASAWSVFAPSLYWFYPVVFLTSVGARGLELAGYTIQMEFGPPAEVPRYVALTFGAQFIPRLVAPLAAGAIADSLGYHTVFVYATLSSFLSLVAILFMRDPRGSHSAA
jgi:MFS family permease